MGVGISSFVYACRELLWSFYRSSLGHSLLSFWLTIVFGPGMYQSYLSSSMSFAMEQYSFIVQVLGVNEERPKTLFIQGLEC